MYEWHKVELITVFWTIFSAMIFTFHCLKSRKQTTKCMFHTMKYRLVVVQKQFRLYLLFLYVSFFLTLCEKVECRKWNVESCSCYIELERKGDDA